MTLNGFCSTFSWLKLTKNMVLNKAASISHQVTFCGFATWHSCYDQKLNMISLMWVSCAQMSLVQHRSDFWVSTDVRINHSLVFKAVHLFFSFFLTVWNAADSLWCGYTDHLWHAEGYKQQRRQSEFTRDASERQNVSGATPEEEGKVEKINSKAGWQIFRPFVTWLLAQWKACVNGVY